MRPLSPKLKPIIEAVRNEIIEAKTLRPISFLKDKIKSEKRAQGAFSVALSRRFGLIAEIKEKSPSAGDMWSENVRDSFSAYEQSPIVSAVSVLTQKSHFGMSIERLEEAREKISKPLLRKDFIFDEYQVYEAKAFGADAILLMANILTKSEMLHLWQVANKVGVEVLFETHVESHIKDIPKGAAICGINCREMDSDSRTSIIPLSYTLSRNLYKLFGDRTTDISRLKMIKSLPKKAIKVAESGVTPSTIQAVRELGYNSALIGTSLLKASAGIISALSKFESALASQNQSVLEQRPALGVPSHA